MLCENCDSKTATITLTQNINGEVKSIKLCKDCAASLGFLPANFGASAPFVNIDGLFSSLFTTAKPNIKNPSPALACDFCKTTLSELQKTGKCGCARCYDVFSQTIESVIRQIHSASVHLGKTPFASGGESDIQQQINSLKFDLNAAIHNEEYEKAAEIRDKIKELSSDGGGKNEKTVV